MTPPSWLVPWIPLISALVAVSGTLVGVYLGGRLAHGREREAQAHRESREREAQKLKDERDTAYLVGLVVGALEHFSEACEAVAFDDGHEDQDGYTRTRTDRPTFEREKFQVEWTVLPSELMFAVLDLPHRIREAERIIDGGSEHATPPDFPEFFQLRRYHFARLGVDAANLAISLRRHAGIALRSENPDWNSIAQMQGVMAEIEQRWATPVVLPDLPPISAS